MINYNQESKKVISLNGSEIHSFIESGSKELNADWVTIDSFGEEWTKFDSFSEEEIELIGHEYFHVLDFNQINDYYVLDLGCGTGRWTKYISEKVKFIEAVDPSMAVFSAANLLNDTKNVRISQASADNLPFEDEAFDLIFSLGVLHHIPDTRKAMYDAIFKLKKGGKFLVYLYYSLDNRGILFKSLFKFSNAMRYLISKLPQRIKSFVCDILAIIVYMPLIFSARLLKRFSPKSNFWKKIPLSAYWNKSFHVIRNDSLDRFGTPLEQRFSKKEIKEMMEGCGLKNIIFSDNAPFWVAVGEK